MKRQRMRDKNSSLFISLLTLVNFNNAFAPLLYFKNLSGYCWKNVSFDLPKFNVCVIRQIKFPPKFFRDPPKFLPAKISSSQIMYIYNHYALFIIIAQILENLTFPLFMAIIKTQSDVLRKLQLLRICL